MTIAKYIVLTTDNFWGGKMVNRQKRKTGKKAIVKPQIQEAKQESSTLNLEIAKEVWEINKNKYLKLLSVVGALWTIFIGVGFW